MERDAREKRVRIETNSLIGALPADGRVIVATSLEAARGLLEDETLRWESGRAVLLDIGVKRDRRDPFAVFDFDDGAMVERFTSQDPTLALQGHDLFQSEIPSRSNESKADAIGRLESLLDLALPGWRGRVTWRREQTANYPHRRPGSARPNLARPTANRPGPRTLSDRELRRRARSTRRGIHQQRPNGEPTSNRGWQLKTLTRPLFMPLSRDAMPSLRDCVDTDEQKGASGSSYSA